jgi:hypothetical protein
LPLATSLQRDHGNDALAGCLLGIKKLLQGPLPFPQRRSQSLFKEAVNLQL